MKLPIDGLLPNMTTGFISRVLIVEIYFLLRSGKSPAYFSLTDFLDSYSIEILYVAVFLSLLSGWLIIPIFVGYTVIIGGLAWCGKKILGLFKYEGIPIFSALSQHNRRNSVSVKLASDYAFASADEKLQARVHEYEQKTQDSLSNEALAASNFLLIIMIALISFQTGAPNFLMKVSNFADPLVSGNAYKIVLGFLFLQGVLGRVSSFYLLHAAGHLPPNFFRDENERKKVANWTTELIDRYKPLVRDWVDKG